MSITKSATSPLEQLDFEHTIPCEGQDHYRGYLGHVISEPGAFYVIAPCCGPKLVYCKSRVAKILRDGLLSCHTCKRQHLTELFQFIPID